MSKMNPLAPHYRHKQSSGGDGSDLATVFGNLRTSSVATPSTRMDSSDSSANGIHVNGSHANERAVVKFEPQVNNKQSHAQEHELLERARNELQEQSQLMIHTKLLRLSDQVGELLAQRAAAEEKQAESDRVIKELREQNIALKTQANTQHTHIEAIKRIISERFHQVQQLETRLDAVQKSSKQHSQQQTDRLEKLESFARKANSEILVHTETQKKHDARIDALEAQTAKASSDDPTKAETANITHRVAQLEMESSGQEESYLLHERYLKQIGETLYEHQSSLDKTDASVEALGCKVEMLSTTTARPRGDGGHQVNGGSLKMEPTATTILQLQSQINRLEKDLQQKIMTANTHSDSSSVDEVESLQIQMDEVKNKVREMEPEVKVQKQKHEHMNMIALASKIELEKLFFQLTKEYRGLCLPEQIMFGVDEEDTFILRQYVLDRLAATGNAQIEWERLKECPEMPR